MQMQARLQMQMQNTKENLNIAEKSGLFPFEIFVRLWQNFPSDSHCIRICVPLVVYQSHPFSSVQLYAQTLNPSATSTPPNYLVAVSGVWAAVVHDDVEVSFALFDLDDNKPTSKLTES